MGVFSSASRLMRAGFVLARHDALLPQEYQSKLPPWTRAAARLARLIARPGRADNPGERFARALEQLGPTYVKLGQFLATRADILDPRFAAGLSRLKDDAPRFPRAEALRAIEAEFGRPADDVYAAFGEAVAAASVAQVHRASLRDGSAVAVKILRPGVEQRLTRDVESFRLAARALERFAPASRRLAPRAFVETLARSLALEIDLRLEAAAASEMAEISAGFDGFRVPLPDWPRCGRRVMTTTWIDGAPLSDPAAVAALGVDRRALAAKVMEVFLSSALEYGVFHADMHEGNLFVAANGDLVLVDFGIMGRLGRGERRYLADIIYGFLERDYERAAAAHFDAGYVPGDFARAEFAAALRAVGEPIFGKTAQDMPMSRVLLQLFEITELFHMQLRPELVLLQKTMVQAEGVARTLDPQLDIWAVSRPVVERFLRAELGAESAIGDAVDDLRRLRAAAKHLPQAMQDMATLAAAWRNGAVALDAGTVDALSRRMSRSRRSSTLALWTLALAAIALVTTLWLA